MNDKLLIICGPTATGKTSLGLKLAPKFKGEIISADSRQVYQDMDIGTGKDISTNFKYKISNLGFNQRKVSYYQTDSIKLWGYDVAKPDEEFTVAHFYQLAWKLIHHIWQSDKLPIIVGGTGLYLNTLLNPPKTLNIPPDLHLRKKLEELTTHQLQLQLKKINLDKYNSMNQSDQNNPRRLIRAIETSKVTRSSDNDKKNHKVDSLWIGLKASLSTIDAHIATRVKQRLNQGMITEVKKLMRKYPNWNTPAFSATGYQQIRQYLQGKIKKEQAIQTWITSERQYARRQLTWFKTNPSICWFDISSNQYRQNIVHQVNRWYTGFK